MSVRVRRVLRRGVCGVVGHQYGWPFQYLGQQWMRRCLTCGDLVYTQPPEAKEGTDHR